MKRTVFAIALVALIFTSWVVYRSLLSEHTIARVSQSEEMFRAIVRDLGYAEVTSNGQLWVVVKNSKESVDEFLDRCDAVALGQLAGEHCWESDCTGPSGPYHIRFCFPSQAVLDSIVALYCDDPEHDCVECD